MNARWLVMVAVGTLAVAGCDKTEKPQGTAASSAELADEDVPVAQDYLDQATTEITEANYKAQLDALEKELESAKD
jgi:outer membrane murein-binding lipoprotein Lpp